MKRRGDERKSWERTCAAAREPKASGEECGASLTANPQQLHSARRKGRSLLFQPGVTSSRTANAGSPLQTLGYGKGMTHRERSNPMESERVGYCSLLTVYFSLKYCKPMEKTKQIETNNNDFCMTKTLEGDLSCNG